MLFGVNVVWFECCLVCMIPVDPVESTEELPDWTQDAVLIFLTKEIIRQLKRFKFLTLIKL